MKKGGFGEGGRGGRREGKWSSSEQQLWREGHKRTMGCVAGQGLVGLVRPVLADLDALTERLIVL